MFGFAGGYGKKGFIGYEQGEVTSLALVPCILLLSVNSWAELVLYLFICFQIYHAKFFKTCKIQKAVKEAFRFCKLVPNPTLSTFNMLMSVCASSQDSEGKLTSESFGTLSKSVIMYCDYASSY